MASRPLAALFVVLAAALALILPVLGGSGRVDPGSGRLAGDVRFDPGLMRLSPLALAPQDHLRKAQSLKVQPKKWAPGGGEAALLAAASGPAALPALAATSFFAPSPAPGRRPVKAHPPRAPPVILSAV